MNHIDETSDRNILVKKILFKIQNTINNYALKNQVLLIFLPNIGYQKLNIRIMLIFIDVFFLFINNYLSNCIYFAFYLEYAYYLMFSYLLIVYSSYIKF